MQLTPAYLCLALCFWLWELYVEGAIIYGHCVLAQGPEASKSVRYIDLHGHSGT